MNEFGWISQRASLPARWDLRRQGWRLGSVEPDPSGKRRESFPLLCDYQGVSPRRLSGLGRHRRRMLLLGVDGGMERAGLLAAQFADALPADVALGELARRAQRVALLAKAMPRYRSAGPMLLDLFHRDARVGLRWLGLLPHEFDFLWRMAGQPGARITREQLLADVWRRHHEPGNGGVESHVAHLQDKLTAAGLGAIVAADPRGGYALAPGESGGLAIPLPNPDAAPDSHVLMHEVSHMRRDGVG